MKLRLVYFAPFLIAAIPACTKKATQSPVVAPAPTQLMSPQDLQAIPSQPADFRVSYGSDSSQYGELRVPPGAGPHPVAILIHGGCFKAAYATLRDLSPMGDALKANGIATWNVEYRRVGQPGGGWPGTYQDVGHAVNYLRTVAPQHELDLSRVVIVGHSAGGNLAMWAAARGRIPTSSELYAPNPLRVRGVIDLAGPLDMTANIAGYQALCRDSVITELLGGTPAAMPERYAQVSPIRLVPSGIPQVVIIGDHDDFLPRPIADSYVRRAEQSGDKVRLILIPNAGHFEIASPRAAAWTQVAAAIQSLLDGKLPR